MTRRPLIDGNRRGDQCGPGECFSVALHEIRQLARPSDPPRASPVPPEPRVLGFGEPSSVPLRGKVYRPSRRRRWLCGLRREPPAPVLPGRLGLCPARLHQGQGLVQVQPPTVRQCPSQELSSFAQRPARMAPCLCIRRVGDAAGVSYGASLCYRGCHCLGACLASNPAAMTPVPQC